jgi:putative salt-induced outer membrane protein YdiY
MSAERWDVATRGCRWTSTTAVWLGLLCVPAATTADEITVKGTTLRGTIKSMSATELEMDTEYGKGTLTIKMKDVENIKSDARYYVLYGEEAQTSGRILGLSNGVLLVGEDAAVAEKVDVATVQSVYGAEKVETGMLGSLRSNLRYWTGSFDLGFGLTQSTVDTTTLATGFGAERRKSPTRFLLGVKYGYGTQDRDNEPKTTLADNLSGLLRGEYDLTEKVYAFGMGDAKYDAIQRLSLRGVPQAGPGYRFYKTDDAFLQAETGGAWVYQKYFGGEEDDFWAVRFGGEAGGKTWRDMAWSWTGEYLPAVDNWADNYLLRTEAALLFPMTDILNLKFALLDEYNNQPAPDATHNNLATTLGLSLVY